LFDARRAVELKGDSSSTAHPILNLESTMIKHALFVRLEAKPRKEPEVAQFLQAGLGMAQQEGTTPVWFALQLGPSTFGVFDAFFDEAGRQAHLNGSIAQALGANAPKLLAQAPSIERINVLGAKLPG
jgi:quinol monooxygenase YgiN